MVFQAIHARGDRVQLHVRRVTVGDGVTAWWWVDHDGIVDGRDGLNKWWSNTKSSPVIVSHWPLLLTDHLLCTILSLLTALSPWVIASTNIIAATDHCFSLVFAFYCSSCIIAIYNLCFGEYHSYHETLLLAGQGFPLVIVSYWSLLLTGNCFMFVVVSHWSLLFNANHGSLLRRVS